MKSKFIFLGTGSSLGVPVIGCSCPTCSSSHLKNKRFRTSGLLKVQDKTILIDIGPDFREQALRNNICHLDGVLITHTHYDHIAGLDELRIYSFIKGSNIPCILSKESFEEIRRRYYYIFKEALHGDSSTVMLDFIVLEGNEGEVNFLNLPISYFCYHQGSMKVTGFRLGNFAYITDIKNFDKKIFKFLEGVETLVVSALRKSDSKIHFSLDDAVDFANAVQAKKTYLTHIAHELEHESINYELPKHVQLGFDGLELDITWK
jgi:phosphoribosyl 1,2-cyclic phosphate phosphodiesterase